MPFVVWRGLDGWRSEAARVALMADGLTATGTQLGAAPMPYRLDYQLDARGGFQARRLALQCSGEGWERRLLLQRTGSGGWSAQRSAEGHDDFPADSELPDLSVASDCDVQYSPLTNTIPIRRHRLHESGECDLQVAFVEVPSLQVRLAPQRYEHVRRAEGRSGPLVRYVSQGGAFSAELQLGVDGLLEVYGGYAERVREGT
jgi:hypothetical protein